MSNVTTQNNSTKFEVIYCYPDTKFVELIKQRIDSNTMRFIKFYNSPNISIQYIQWLKIIRTSNTNQTSDITNFKVVSHRDDYFNIDSENCGASKIEYYPNGNLKSEEWFYNGIPISNNIGTTKASYFESGQFSKIEWILNSHLFDYDDINNFDKSELKTIVATYYENGNEQTIEFKQGNKFLMDENFGPNRLVFYESGKLFSKQWINNNGDIFKTYTDQEKFIILNQSGKKIDKWFDYSEINNQIVQTNYFNDGKLSSNIYQNPIYIQVEEYHTHTQILKCIVKICTLSNVTFSYVETYDYNGLMISQSWYVNNKLHRDYLPAFIVYNMNTICRCEWHQNGILSRSSSDFALPNIVEYHSTGKIKREEWVINNCLHRLYDKPACIFYDENGNVLSKYWYLNGVKHRDNNKPAVIDYNENGTLKCKKWYVYGIPFRSDELFVELQYNDDNMFLYSIFSFDNTIIVVNKFTEILNLLFLKFVKTEIGNPKYQLHSFLKDKLFELYDAHFNLINESVNLYIENLPFTECMKQIIMLPPNGNFIGGIVIQEIVEDLINAKLLMN